MARNSSQIRIFSVIDASDLVLRPEDFGVNCGCSLDGSHWGQAAVLYQHLKVERLSPMYVGFTVGSAAHHDFHSFGGGGHLNSVLKYGDHPILAAGVFGVVVVHVGFDVTLESRIVIEPLGDDHVRLFLIQPECVLDRVASRNDGVLLALASVDMAARFFSEAVSFFNYRLHDQPRGSHYVFGLSRGAI